MSDTEKRDWIRGLEPVERKWGFLLAAYVALVTLVSTLPDAISVHYVKTTGSVCGHHHSCYVSTQRSAQIFFGVQIVLALAGTASAYFRKRPLLAFCMLLAAFASTGATLSLLFGIPPLVFAGWLFLRSWRVQRYGTTDAKAVTAIAAERRKSGQPSPSGLGSLFRRRPAASSTIDATSRPASSTPRSAPDASKRYTPKKTKPAERKNRYASNEAKSSKAPAKGTKSAGRTSSKT